MPRKAENQEEEDLTKDDITKNDLKKHDLTKDGLIKDDLIKDDLTKNDLTKDDLIRDDLTKDSLTKDDFCLPSPETLFADSFSVKQRQTRCIITRIIIYLGSALLPPETLLAILSPWTSEPRLRIRDLCQTEPNVETDKYYTLFALAQLKISSIKFSLI